VIDITKYTLAFMENVFMIVRKPRNCRS